MTTGCAGSSRAAADAGWVEVLISSPAKKTDHEPADEEVDRNDQNRGPHDGLRCGTADTLGAALCVHAVEAADAGDDEAKDDGLDQALENVGITQRLVGGMEILGTVLSKHEDRNRGPAHGAHSVRDDGEEKEHDHGGEKPRGHQFLER